MIKYLFKEFYGDFFLCISITLCSISFFLNDSNPISLFLILYCLIQEVCVFGFCLISVVRSRKIDIKKIVILSSIIVFVLNVLTTFFSHFFNIQQRMLVLKIQLIFQLIYSIVWTIRLIGYIKLYRQKKRTKTGDGSVS